MHFRSRSDDAATQEPDVIVVGAGAAGAVLAARLSEDARRSVLLLEAGPDQPTLSDVPTDLLDADAVPMSHDWGYKSQPGFLERELALYRGKVAGGSTTRNAAVANRPSRSDLDEWVAAGNPGWGHDDVLDFLRRIEDDPQGDPRWHGRGGPVPIHRDLGNLSRLHQSFVESAARRGHPRVEDVNGPEPFGVGATGRNVSGRVRESTNLTYLRRARERENLVVRGDAEVDRLLFEGTALSGVRLVSGEELLASQVILAAGAYGTPAILLRSGVGPAAELTELGIEVVADRGGVGKGLVEQPFFPHVFAADPEKVTQLAPPLGVTLLVPEPGTTDVPWLHLVPSTLVPHEFSPTGVAFGISIAVLKPSSRGTVTLASTDPTAAPRIDVGLASDARDRAALVAGVRLSREIARTAPLSELIVGEVLPGEAAVTDEEIEATIRGAVDVYHHPIATARMGPVADPTAVVDTVGRVHGVEGLRVADASIIPIMPSAAPALTVMMVAERIAADIRGDVRAGDDRALTERREALARA